MVMLENWLYKYNQIGNAKINWERVDLYTTIRTLILILEKRKILRNDQYAKV